MSRRVHDVEPIVTPLAAPIGGVREDGLDAAQSGVTSENCDPVFAVVPKENGAGAGRTHLKSSRTLATFELIGGGRTSGGGGDPSPTLEMRRAEAPNGLGA